MNLPIQEKLEPLIVSWLCSSPGIDIKSQSLRTSFAFQFEESKPSESKVSATENQTMDVDVVGGGHDIDPEDDMAGLMREMNHTAKQQSINESIISETSTDTAFSMSAAMSDKDDLVSM